MARSRATSTILALAALATGCGDDGGDDATETERFEPTIAQIHRVTPDYTREDVKVTGTAVPVKDNGFVLRQDDDRIYVDSNPNVVLPLSAGDRVTVVGQVRAITPLLEHVVERPRGVPSAASEAARRAVDRTPTDTGDPYIEADAVNATG